MTTKELEIAMAMALRDETKDEKIEMHTVIVSDLRDETKDKKYYDSYETLEEAKRIAKRLDKKFDAKQVWWEAYIVGDMVPDIDEDEKRAICKAIHTKAI